MHRNIVAARSAAKAAKAAFQDCEYAEGVAKAEALEAQAEAIEGGERAAREGSEALAAGRAALASGQLEEARRQAGRARERFSTEGLGDVGRKGLEGVGELERGVAEAETKAGHVREGLEASFQYSFFCSLFVLSVSGRRWSVLRRRWERGSGRSRRRSSLRLNFCSSAVRQQIWSEGAQRS
jgi:hypothetical protein